MMSHRPFASLGRSQHGGIDARHHFSIAAYQDRDRMGWGALRVCNDDAIAPGAGFPLHRHADMEIVTYVRRGAVTHRDSLGNAACMQAGTIQVMSAGRGIRHSEFNEGEDTASVVQLWIRPSAEGTEPRRDSLSVSDGDGDGMVRVVASGFAGDGKALALHAEARVLLLTMPAGGSVTHALEPGQFAYVVVTEGRATINGLAVAARDGIAIADELGIAVEAVEECELILVETA